MKRLEKECDCLYSTHGSWAHTKVFDTLTRAVRDLCKGWRLTFREADPGPASTSPTGRHHAHAENLTIPAETNPEAHC